MVTMSDDSAVQAVLCSKCFKNQGLKLEAARIGVGQKGLCPHCSAADGRKLDKERVEELAFRFFVRGTYHRATYGGTPVVQMNGYHYGKTNIKVSDSLKADVELLEETARIGFFYYGPRGWMVGEVEPLKALQDKRQCAGVITQIMDAYPRLSFGTGEIFYRLRKGPNDPAAASEYDSPPDSFLGTYRFDSPSLPILYASQDLEVCFHECRVSVEDELYVGTLRPLRNLQLLDLTEVVQDDGTEFESIDIAIHMLFLAGTHSYEISREIAIAASAAGLDGIVYPSYFSVMRTGRMPIETAYGISLRRFKGHEAHAKAQIIPNLALFGRPVKTGSISVEWVNRIVLTRIIYDGVFGPVDYSMSTEQVLEETRPSGS